MAANSFSIREAAEASGLNAKTIRYYEQIGLVPRARRGNRAARTGGNRIYHELDIERLRFVRSARLLGLGLANIHDLLTAADGGCPGDQPLYHETLAEHLKAIDTCSPCAARWRSCCHASAVPAGALGPVAGA